MLDGKEVMKMSSIFEAVRSHVPVRAAAERYGLEVNDSGMARCPFHNDRTPSMKLYADHFYCFGCGKYGDVVDLTSELLCVPSYDAACALAEEFGVDAARWTPRPALRQFREDLLRCQRVLRDYLRLLRRWRMHYAPTGPDEPIDDRYAEACRMIDTVDYLTDLLIVGSLDLRVKLVDDLLHNDLIDRLEKRLAEIKTTAPVSPVAAGGEQPLPDDL